MVTWCFWGTSLQVSMVARCFKGMQLLVCIVARCFWGMSLQVVQRIVTVASRWCWVANGGAMLFGGLHSERCKSPRNGGLKVEKRRESKGFNRKMRRK